MMPSKIDDIQLYLEDQQLIPKDPHSAFMMVVNQRLGSFWQKNKTPLSQAMQISAPQQVYFCDQENQPYYIKGEANEAQVLLCIEQEKDVTIILDHTDALYNKLEIKVHCAFNSRCRIIQYGQALEGSEISVQAKVEKDARFEAYPFYINLKATQHEWVCHLMGYKAHAAVEGGWYLNENHSLTTNVVMHHGHQDTTSRQLLKGVVDDSAFSHFKGSIYIHPEGSGSDAYQANYNLLCSANARATTEPGLDIYKEDVKASHGATIFHLTDEDLFYCRARGLSKETAKNWRILGHLNEVIHKNPHGKSATSIKNNLNQIIRSS